MNLIELSDRLDNLAKVGKLRAHESVKLLEIARAVPVPQLPEALQTLLDAADRMAGELPTDDLAKRQLQFMAGAMGIAARFELPASPLLAGYHDAVMTGLDALLSAAQPGPAVPTIGEAK